MSDIATKLATVAENQQKVYDAGYAKGQAEGKQAEYDAFWDNLQSNGALIPYVASFGAAWNDATFKPKHNIRPTDAYMMFRSSKVTDLTNLGVEVDFSNCFNFQYAFTFSSVSHIGIVDVRNSKSIKLTQTFAQTTKLHTIDKIIIDEDSGYFDGTFESAIALTNITFEGVIGKSSINFQWSTLLSKASITSIINALSATKSGLSATLSKTAVTNAFGSTTADEWINLTNTKPNWTISLV